MTVDDRKHGRGEPELRGDVEPGTRGDQSFDCLEMASQRGEHEGRLTEPIEGIDVGAARDLRAKSRRVTVPGGPFPLARHRVSFVIPPSCSSVLGELPMTTTWNTWGSIV